jgi:hypothetical protein
MCHLSQSRNATLLSMFIWRRTPSRSWSWYLREKALRKLNSFRRRTIMIMGRKKKITRRKKKMATKLKAKMMKTTLL